MSEKKVRVTYRCLHPSCVVFCREGILTMDEELFNDLLASAEGDDVFRSPRNTCRLGFSQNFKVEGIESIEGERPSAEQVEKHEPSLESDNPLEILAAEHRNVLKKLEEIELQLRRRDVEGLWVSTAELENDITLHSVQKEETVLFPMVKDMLPLAEGLIAMVQEDHREFMTLLFSFRNALVDGDILDGLARSIIVNLRSHIRKEDEEFFYLLDRYIDAETRKRLLDGRKTLDEAFVPTEAGDRAEAKHRSTARERSHFDEAASAARDARLADAASGGGCCHEAPSD
jgi:hemerythrin-like domain-containing protein